MPEWAFFIAKYFGSGVIIATAFIHVSLRSNGKPAKCAHAYVFQLLAPANDALTDPCLTGPITEYDWAEGIALMTIFVLFFVELMTMRYAKFGHSHGHDHDVEEQDALGIKPAGKVPDELAARTAPEYEMRPSTSSRHPNCPTTPHVPGDDHLSHSRHHVDNEDVSNDWSEVEEGKHIFLPEAYAAQLTAIFILEFGIIFHSVFIGLTLAVSGKEFTTLYVVLVFHQTFEGLGLGTRLAAIPWPKSKKRTPYLLACGYAISTPIAIAIGLGVRQSYPPGSQTTLITNGIFDSISAGVLIYTGLVELMAHEFMFSNYMQRASIKTVLSAFFVMCLGAGKSTMSFSNSGNVVLKLYQVLWLFSVNGRRQLLPTPTFSCHIARIESTSTCTRSLRTSVALSSSYLAFWTGAVAILLWTHQRLYGKAELACRYVYRRQCCDNHSRTFRAEICDIIRRQFQGLAGRKQQSLVLGLVK